MVAKGPKRTRFGQRRAKKGRFDPIKLFWVISQVFISPRQSKACLTFLNLFTHGKHFWVGTVLYCMVLHGISLYCMVLHGISLYCMVLHSITRCCTVLYDAMANYRIVHLVILEAMILDTHGKCRWNFASVCVCVCVCVCMCVRV